MMRRYLFLILALLLYSCSADYTPKPKGYPHLEFPETVYAPFNQYADFNFLLSEQTDILNERDSLGTVWFDIRYPDRKATIYCSYIPVTPANFDLIEEESRNFVYVHLRKADQFQEQAFENPEQKIYGVVYRIEGEVASPIQFVLTDSVASFFRGALYFDYVPNRDSIAPVINYLDNEIQTIIESFQWKQ